MGTSIFLAQVMSLYFVIMGIAMFMNRGEFEAAITGFLESRTSHMILAFITLVIGILLVVSHNLWVADWRVIITVIAWLAFIKGIMRMVFPKHTLKWMKIIRNSQFYYSASVVVIILGLVLGYFGFMLN